MTRGPTIPRNAGRNVSANSTDVMTTIEPPMPIERMAGAANSNSPDRPMATARPEKATALPAVATERCTASPTVLPWRSSSLKRLTMNSE